MNAKERKEHSREWIDATKNLTLDERVEILRGIFTDTGLPIRMNGKQQKQLANELETRGYMPMMFSHAYRIILSGENK